VEAARRSHRWCFDADTTELAMLERRSDRLSLPFGGLHKILRICVASGCTSELCLLVFACVGSDTRCRPRSGMWKLVVRCCVGCARMVSVFLGGVAAGCGASWTRIDSLFPLARTEGGHRVRWLDALAKGLLEPQHSRPVGVLDS